MNIPFFPSGLYVYRFGRLPCSAVVTPQIGGYNVQIYLRIKTYTSTPAIQ